MAKIVTKNPVVKGAPTTLTLNVEELLNIDAIAGDDYFSVLANLAHANLVYDSNPGNQKEVVSFNLRGLESESTPVTAAFSVTTNARDAFQIQAIVLIDNDGGYLRVSRADLAGDVSQFDIVLDVFPYITSSAQGYHRGSTAISLAGRGNWGLTGQVSKDITASPTYVWMNAKNTSRTILRLPIDATSPGAPAPAGNAIPIVRSASGFYYNPVLMDWFDDKLFILAQQGNSLTLENPSGDFYICQGSDTATAMTSFARLKFADGNNGEVYNKMFVKSDGNGGYHVFILGRKAVPGNTPEQDTLVGIAYKLHLAAGGTANWQIPDPEVPSETEEYWFQDAAGIASSLIGGGVDSKGNVKLGGWSADETQFVYGCIEGPDQTEGLVTLDLPAGYAAGSPECAQLGSDGALYMCGVVVPEGWSEDLLDVRSVVYKDSELIWEPTQTEAAGFYGVAEISGNVYVVSKFFPDPQDTDTIEAELWIDGVRQGSLGFEPVLTDANDERIGYSPFIVK